MPEDARLAVLPIEMVIMEWKLSREVVFHGFLVALVGLKLVAVRHLAKVLQMRLHLHGTSCRDHAAAHILTPVAPFRRLALLLGSLFGGMRDQAARSVGFFLRLFLLEGNVAPRLLLPECTDAELLGRWRRDWSSRRKIRRCHAGDDGQVASEGRLSVPLGEVA